jgi:hypothetical protein
LEKGFPSFTPGKSFILFGQKDSLMLANRQKDYLLAFCGVRTHAHWNVQQILSLPP